MMKVKDIIDDIKARYPHGYGDEQILSWVNNVTEEVWEYIAVDEIWMTTLEADVRSYKLPEGMDFSAIFAVVVGGKQYTAKRLPDYVTSNIYFKMAEGVISLNPVPQDGAEMYIYYTKKPERVVDINGEMSIRPQFAELVKCGVFCIIAKANGEVELANNYAADYNALLQEVKQKRLQYSSTYPTVKDVTVKKVRR